MATNEAVRLQIILFGEKVADTADNMHYIHQIVYGGPESHTVHDMYVLASRFHKTLKILGFDLSSGLLLCLHCEESYARTLGYIKNLIGETLYVRILNLLAFIGGELARLENAFNIKCAGQSFLSRLKAIEEQENIRRDSQSFVITQRLYEIVM